MKQDMKPTAAGLPRRLIYRGPGGFWYDNGPMFAEFDPLMDTRAARLQAYADLGGPVPAWVRTHHRQMARFELLAAQMRMGLVAQDLSLIEAVPAISPEGVAASEEYFLDNEGIEIADLFKDDVIRRVDDALMQDAVEAASRRLGKTVLVDSQVKALLTAPEIGPDREVRTVTLPVTSRIGGTGEKTAADCMLKFNTEETFGHYPFPVTSERCSDPGRRAVQELERKLFDIELERRFHAPPPSYPMVTVDGLPLTKEMEEQGITGYVQFPDGSTTMWISPIKEAPEELGKCLSDLLMVCMGITFVLPFIGLKRLGKWAGRVGQRIILKFDRFDTP